MANSGKSTESAITRTQNGPESPHGMHNTRTKWTCLACSLLAILGALLTPLRWPPLGIAAVSGILGGVILIAAQKDNEAHAGAIGTMPIVFGALFSRYAFLAEPKGVEALGLALQFSGVAYFASFAITFVFLWREGERKAG